MPVFAALARTATASVMSLLVLACAAPPRSDLVAAPQETRDVVETRCLHALFDAAWETSMRHSPEAATYVGDRRYGDRLDDASPEAEAAEYAEWREQRGQALAIQRGLLSATDRSSLDLFIYGLDEALRYEPLVGFRRMTLGANGGFHTGFADLLQTSPVDTVAAVEQMLARMAAYPRRVEHELQRLREGLGLGWVPPRAVLDRVLANLDSQLAAGADANSPFMAPLVMMGSAIAPAEQALLRERARKLVLAQVLPAQRRLRDFVAADYGRATASTGAFSGYPGGAAVYLARVRTHTTLDLTPAQIHALGLREVARLDADIAAVMADLKWRGDAASFFAHMQTDPRYFHASPQALLASYRDIAKRIDPELPRLFAELPRVPYGVRAMPDHAGAQAYEYYSAPDLDGGRPGWFNANVLAYKIRPTWAQETLVAHEAVPGHHLQNARAAELGELPKFRRASGYGAYGEGWALYAETLGFDLGLYKDPASRWGHIQSQMLRATRLVVDTGIHAFGWSRQQAIDYMLAHGADERSAIESEVDRYTSGPGQALGYMIGQLKIIELRDRAKAKLGERFDVRRFHMVLLDQGAVPLPVLERLVDEWIAVEAGKR